jgi:hypothetical protein
LELFLKILHPLLEGLLRRDINLLQRNHILLDLLSHIHQDHKLVITTHDQLILTEVDDQLIELLRVVCDLTEMIGDVVVTETAEVNPILEGMCDVDNEGSLHELQIGIKATTNLPLRLMHEIW